MTDCLFCERKATARGLCKPHYYQLRAKGDLAAYPTTLGTVSLRDRLLAKRRVAENGCWIWIGQLNSNGYGMIWRGKKAVLAHRVSFELFHRDGASLSRRDLVCHSCDTPKCINPTHLFIGTRTDNNRDAVAKGRNARGETNGQAKLRTADVADIRKADATQSVLAKRYGVRQSTISRIINGRRWRHLA